MVLFGKRRASSEAGAVPPPACGTPPPVVATSGGPSVALGLSQHSLPEHPSRSVISAAEEPTRTHLQRLLDDPRGRTWGRVFLRVLDSAKWLGIDYALDRLIDLVAGDRHIVIGFAGKKLECGIVRLRQLSPAELFHGDIKRSAHLPPLPGDESKPSVLCVGGLAGTAEPWLNFGQAINARLGLRVVFVCLAGHDQSDVEGLKRASLRTWQSGLAEAILTEYNRGFKPIVCTLSTSGIVADSLPAPLRRMIAEVIPVGAPIVVEGFHGKQLDRLMWWYRYCAPARPLLRRILVRPDQTDLLDPQSGLSELTFFKFIPFQAFQALRETQFAVRQGGGGKFFNGLARHLFYGTEDQYLTAEAARRCIEAGGGEAHVHAVTGQHIAMVGRGARRFLRLGMRLIEAILRDPSRYTISKEAPHAAPPNRDGDSPSSSTAAP